MNSSRFALSGLLLVSLVLNGALLLRSSASASEPGTRGQKRSQTKAAPPAEAKATELARCRHQLRVQQLRAAHLTQQQLAALRRPASGTEATDDPAPEKAPQPADFAAQQEMLCTLGLEALRRHWKQGRNTIHDNLARDLASDRAQDKDLQRVLTTYGDALGLSSRERSQLEKRYVPLKSRRVEAALSALESDPPDYLAAFDEAVDLYQDTDTLVQNLYGTEAVDKVRGAELRRRTLVLAVLASMADVEWDRSVEW